MVFRKPRWAPGAHNADYQSLHLSSAGVVGYESLWAVAWSWVHGLLSVWLGLNVGRTGRTAELVAPFPALRQVTVNSCLSSRE